MENLNWTYILYLTVGIPALITLILISRKDNSISVLFFALALLSFLTGVSIDYIYNSLNNAREWGDLLAITITLCGLFVEIRESKPVFARFPIYLTILPLITTFFYPLIIDSVVIKNLIQQIYQGGAIIVAILVISINQILHRQRGFLLTACFIMMAAYISYWFLDNVLSIPGQEVGKIIFILGIIIASIGFKKVSESINTT